MRILCLRRGSRRKFVYKVNNFTETCEDTEKNVTYAKQDADKKSDDVRAPGNGVLDVFDMTGALLGRLVTQGPLNSPWGMAIAPAG